MAFCILIEVHLHMNMKSYKEYRKSDYALFLDWLQEMEDTAEEQAYAEEMIAGSYR
ncbi:MAG: hypothetical protein JRL30_27645 [Deltaproteobacteria bacterium]|nr:hypothetical protein [Deltaproteobacteria bacterium]